MTKTQRSKSNNGKREVERKAGRIEDRQIKINSFDVKMDAKFFVNTALGL